jgi:hypothetical protein
MATVSKKMYRGAASTTVGTTLYTTPGGSSAVVTNIVVANAAASTSTVTIAVGGTLLVPGTSVAPKGLLTVDLKQVMAASDVITGGASTTDVSIFISGVEIA